jgi:cytochrome c-type biogenesis protein
VAVVLDVDVNIGLAFLAGLLSFISPCMLPIYPSYISYITGVFARGTSRAGSSRWHRYTASLHTLAFIVGFSTVFFALGLSATAFGYLFSNYQPLIQRVGGVVIFLLGLFLGGFWQPSFLLREARFDLSSRPAGLAGSVLVGLVFAAGWTPCIGPILTAVLLMSASSPAQGLPMIVAYIIGFAVPFFALSFAIGKIRWLARPSVILTRVAGGLMSLTGLLLFTGQFNRLTTWLIRLFGGFSGF